MPPNKESEILVPVQITRETKELLPIGEVAERLYSGYAAAQNNLEMTPASSPGSTKKRLGVERRIRLGAAKDHYYEHREAYKQAAAEEARKLGYPVRYANQDPRLFTRGYPERLKRRGPRTW